MCGIAGIIGNHERREIVGMLRALRHRGPDGTGIFHDGDCSLGHVRLSIIDVAGGSQPIFNETGDRCIVFNGEIYNYRELRKRLGHHRFRTASDTEVILHLYEDLGPACVRELDGMFAFAIWDRGGLFLARDPIGIKPLYLGKRGGTRYFASEIKALLSCETIEVFPPGHYFTPEGGLQTYEAWEIAPRPSNDIPSLLKEIRDTLEQAVRKRLVADVPVGVFLSGGLDSSLVAALARPHVKRLSTFSVGMAGAPDLPFARQVAKALGTDHHERVYTAEEVRGALVRVIRHLESFDAPLVRSAIPCFFVAELARRHDIKVIQTGEGADELFSGYDYLKRIPGDEALGRELSAITFALHHTNLQRADRATMVHGVEGRVPFLDKAMIRLGLGISPSLKRVTSERPEKWLLRKAFDGMLPPEVLWRTKQKFSEGAGSMHLLEYLADETVDEKTFRRERRLPDGTMLRSREELMYYRIFREHFPHAQYVRLMGRTASYERKGDSVNPSV